MECICEMDQYGRWEDRLIVDRFCPVHGEEAYERRTVPTSEEGTRGA